MAYAFKNGVRGHGRLMTSETLSRHTASSTIEAGILNSGTIQAGDIQTTSINAFDICATDIVVENTFTFNTDYSNFRFNVEYDELKLEIMDGSSVNVQALTLEPSGDFIFGKNIRVLGEGSSVFEKDLQIIGDVDICDTLRGNQATLANLNVTQDAHFQDAVRIDGSLTLLNTVIIEEQLVFTTEQDFEEKIVFLKEVEISNNGQTHLYVGCDASFEENVVIQNDLFVQGDSIFGTDVTVNGFLNINSGIGISGDLSIPGYLTVSGDISTNSTVNTSGLIVKNNGFVYGILNVSGDISTNSTVDTSGLIVRHNGFVYGILNVSGDISTNSTVDTSGLIVRGDTIFYEDITLSGVDILDISNIRFRDGSVISSGSSLTISGNTYFLNQVGIGKQSASYPLDISGNTRITGNIGIGTTNLDLQIGKLTIESSYNQLRLAPPTDLANSVQTSIHFGGGYSQGKTAIITEPTGTWVRSNLHFCLNNDTSFNDATISDSKITILGSNGNVGIGTRTPSYTLDVSGSARITGNVGIGTTNTITNILQIGTINDNVYPHTSVNLEDYDIVIATDKFAEPDIITGIDYTTTGWNGNLFVTSNGTQTQNRGASIAIGGRQLGFSGRHTIFGRVSGVQTITSGGIHGDLVLESMRNGKLFEAIRCHGPSKTVRIEQPLVVSTSPASSETIPSIMLDISGDIRITGNVGIGTTSPSQRLDVSGTVNIITSSDTNPLLDIVNNSSTGGNNLVFPILRFKTRYLSSNPTLTTIDALRVYREVDGTANTLNLLMGPTSGLYVNSTTGNVGIGRTPTTNILDISGSQVIRVGGAPASNVRNDIALTLTKIDTNTTANKSILRFFTRAGGGGEEYGHIGHRYLNPEYGLFMNATEDPSTIQICITKTGNVGIGTTIPAYRLDVQGNLRVISGSNDFVAKIENTNTSDTGSVGGLSIVKRSGGVPALDISSQGYEYPVHIKSNPSSGNNAALYVQRLDTLTNKIAALFDGNVGITNRRATFTITDNSGSGYGINAQPTIIGRNNSYELGFIRFLDTTTPGGTFRGDMAFHTNFNSVPGASPERMRITDTGNVGIATTSPSEKLDVTGNARVTGTITGQEFYSTAHSAYLVPTSVNGNFWVSSDTNIYRNVGNVGIGTSTPDNLLTIHQGLIQLNSVTGTEKFGIYADNNIFQINPRTSTGGYRSIDGFTMDSSGRVGIGKFPVSSYSLDITGDVRATSFTPFTGQHIGFLDISSSNFRPGLVVSTDNKPFGPQSIDNAWVYLRLSNQAKDKCVLGVCSRQSPADPEFGDILFTNYNSVGEGQIIVCGENGDIQAGDLLCSSSIPGIAMKQYDDIIHSYTIGKATLSCEFTPENPLEELLTSCVYYCG